MPLFGGLSLVLFASSAFAASPRGRTEVVTQRSLELGVQGWRVSDFRAGGSAAATFSASDRRGRWGSVELRLPPGSSYHGAYVERWADDVELDPDGGLHVGRLGFGRLADLHGASFSWRRDGASTAPVFLAPAFRLIVHDPDAGTRGETWELVWEPVYNGYSVVTGVPVNQWVRSEIAAETVWRAPLYREGALAYGYCSAQPSECYRYDRGPNDWGFGPNTVIVGINIAAGTGWGGSFIGYVDDVELAVGRRSHRWNFEPVRWGRR